MLRGGEGVQIFPSLFVSYDAQPWQYNKLYRRSRYSRSYIWVFRFLSPSRMLVEVAPFCCRGFAWNHSCVSSKGEHLAQLLECSGSFRPRAHKLEPDRGKFPRNTTSTAA